MDKLSTKNFSKNISNLENILPSFMRNIQNIEPLFKHDTVHNRETLMIIQFHSKCPICYRKFASPCNPNQCNHLFCIKCLEKWSKSSRTCPLCRKEFDRIIRIYFK